MELFGKAKHKLVIVAQKEDNEIEVVKTVTFNPSETEKRVRIGKDHYLFSIDLRTEAYRTSKNTHFYFVDFSSGSAYAFQNKNFNVLTPIDADTLNANRLVKVAMNQVTSNFGILLPILSLALGCLIGFVVGQFINIPSGASQ